MRCCIRWLPIIPRHAGALGRTASTAALEHVVSDHLRAGYHVRRPTLDDAPGVQALLAAVEIAETGNPGSISLDDLLGIWQRIDLARDAWLVVAPEGQLAGYGYARRLQFVRNAVEAYVHPAHTGQGIGITLLRLAEAWAREAVLLAPRGAEVFVTNWIPARNLAACDLLQREGYQAVRYFRRMGIALAATSPASWPTGLTVYSAADIGDLRPFFEITEECMADHWDHVAVPFESWVARRTRARFDPGLWFLAMEGETPAGAVLCRSSAGGGWVDTLVVRRAYRQQGRGSALLALAFRTLAELGHEWARLIVDAENLTGATRLYERAGMQIEQEYAAYRKTLGIGR